MFDRGMIPADAQAVAIVVLLYTVLNAVAAGLVVLMHMRHGEPFGYVPLCAMFMIISITAAFIQQIHFYTNFESLQVASYNYQVSSHYTGKPAFTGAHSPLDIALYEIQLYCYNVESLLFLCWIASLWRHVWRLRIGLFDKDGHAVATTIKTVVIVLPAILIGIANAPPVDRTPGVSLILCNILLAGSVAIGLVLLVLVFYKYVSIQKYLGDSSSAGEGFFARFRWRIKFSVPSSAEASSQQSRNMGNQMVSGVFDPSAIHQPMEEEMQLPNEKRESTAAPPTDWSMYDKWLLIRFYICFVLLCIMQIYLIYYSFSRYLSYTQDALGAKLDLSSTSAIISVVTFIPGVTLGLVIFIIFGTTGPFRRDYARCFSTLFSRAPTQKRRSLRSSFIGLYRTESVVRLTNLGPVRLGNDDTGVGTVMVGKSRVGFKAEYRVSVMPVEDGLYEDRQLGAGIMMTTSVKQSDGI